MTAELRLDFERERLTQSARILLTSVLLLVAIGVVFVFSSSSYDADLEGSLFHYVYKQGQGVLLGGLLLLVVASMRPERWLNMAPTLLLFTVALLVAVFAFESRNGAHRWILMAGMSFQPSELAKLTVPLFIAWCVHRFPSLHLSRGEVTVGARQAFRSRWELERGGRVVMRLGQLLAVGIVFGLIAIQPDFGTAAFVAAVAALLLLITRIPWQYVAAAVTAAIPGGYLILRERDPAELWQRMLGFLDPDSVDQVRNSLNAIGSGGLLGKGLGMGQAKQFVPEVYNDFVFASFAEETGFVGVLLLFALYSTVLFSGWRVVTGCPHPALRLLGLAIVVNLVAQAILNIAVATASAPTKGIGLPFISLGSTSLSVALLEVGILIAISRLRRPENHGAALPGSPEFPGGLR